jgi:S1-C subfamily serine protease
MGSGMIVTNEGHILTNAHVVERATKLEISTSDGVKHKGAIVAADKELDLAILKIDASGHPTVQLDESADLRPGQVVLTVANPLGYHWSVSTGIISGVGRQIRAQGNRMYENLIQTTAPLNPGSSGGPLVAINKEVIGVNVATALMAQGISFAIPTHANLEVINGLIEGKVQRRYLFGVLVSPMRIDPRYQAQYKLTTDVGLLVQGVYKNSVAESVGFNRGDLLLYADGKPLSDIKTFRSVLQSHQDGSNLKMTIIRGTQIYELEFALTPEGQKPRKPKAPKKAKGFKIPID